MSNDTATSTKALACVEVDQLPILEASKLLAQSGLTRDGKEPGKVYAKLRLGRDLGISDVAAINGIGIGPNATIILSAQIMLALVKMSGRYKVRYKQRDAKACIIELSEKVDGKWESTGAPISFTWDDAVRAGLSTKDTYKRFPTDLLTARCIAAMFRSNCAEVAAGASCYTPEEIPESGFRTDPVTMSMVSEADPEPVPDAEAVEVPPKPATKPKPVSAAPPPKPTNTTSDRKAVVAKLLQDTNSDSGAVLRHYGVDSLDKFTPAQLTDAEARLRQKLAAPPQTTP